MSTNCIGCVKNERTGPDLLCDACRAAAPRIVRSIDCPAGEHGPAATYSLVVPASGPSDGATAEVACRVTCGGIPRAFTVARVWEHEGPNPGVLFTKPFGVSGLLQVAKLLEQTQARRSTDTAAVKQATATIVGFLAASGAPLLRQAGMTTDGSKSAVLVCLLDDPPVVEVFARDLDKLIADHGLTSVSPVARFRIETPDPWSRRDA